MLKSYGRRFILSNMILSGLVMLAAFIMLGVMTWQREYNDLESTMSIVVKPWNTSTLGGSGEDKQPREGEGKAPNGGQPDKQTNDSPKPQKPAGGEKERAPDQRREKEQLRRSTYELFTTIMYHSDTGEYSVISDGTSVSSDDAAAALEAVNERKEDFGTLHKYGIIYYRERTQNEYKIAMISSSYITARLAKNVFILALIYIVIMGGIFIISIKLSRLAAKPLEQAIEMERNFVTDISHDLKTPITVVLTNNSIIKSNPQATVSEQMQWVTSTDEAAKNMMKLVSEMLTLSSLDAVGRSVDKMRISLSGTAEKCGLQLESLAYEHKVDVVSDIEDDVFIMSTAEYTERICSSLIENAIKYEPEGGTVAVTVSKNKKNAELVVRNFTSIISEEDLPHIFERFYRGDKTRSGRTGHGLGLPIVKQMTDLVGGTINVTSTPDEGTVFTVSFQIPD